MGSPAIFGIRGASIGLRLTNKELILMFPKRYKVYFNYGLVVMFSLRYKVYFNYGLVVMFSLRYKVCFNC